MFFRNPLFVRPDGEKVGVLAGLLGAGADLDLLLLGRLDLAERGRDLLEVPRGGLDSDHDLDDPERDGARLLAIRKGAGEVNLAPREHDRVPPGDVLILLGTREQVENLERLTEA